MPLIQVFACAALGYVLYQVFASGLRSARRLGTGFGKAFLAGATLLAIIWPMYPVCWALSEGGNVIGVSEEVSPTILLFSATSRLGSATRRSQITDFQFSLAVTTMHLDALVSRHTVSLVRTIGPLLKAHLCTSAPLDAPQVRL